jgi:endonuclease III
MFRKFNVEKKDKIKIEYDVPNFSQEILKEANNLRQVKPSFNNKSKINESQSEQSEESQKSNLSDESEHLEEKTNLKKINGKDTKTNKKGNYFEKSTNLSEESQDDSEELSDEGISKSETDFHTKVKNNYKAKKEKNDKNEIKVKISKELKNSEIPNNINQIALPTQSLQDVPTILSQFSQMEELKKNIVTPLDRIFKDLEQTKAENYSLYKFKLLIFHVIRGNSQMKHITLFQDYMYLRRIGLTPERLSMVTQEELSKLNIKKIMNRHPIENLRVIAQKIYHDYAGDTPENSVELNNVMTVNGGNCDKTVEKFLKFLKNKEECEIKMNGEISRVCQRLRWSNEHIFDKLHEKLREIFPQEIWNKVNPVLTAFGQDICLTTGPHCFRCPFTKECKFFNRSHDKSLEENYHPTFTRLMNYQKIKRSMKLEDESNREDVPVGENEKIDEMDKSDDKKKSNISKTGKTTKSLKRKSNIDPEQHQPKKIKK